MSPILNTDYGSLNERGQSLTSTNGVWCQDKRLDSPMTPNSLLKKVASLHWILLSLTVRSVFATLALIKTESGIGDRTSF